MAELATGISISGRLRVIGGLLNYTTGTVTFDNEPIWQRYFAPEAWSEIKYDKEASQVKVKMRIYQNLYREVEIGYKLWSGVPYHYQGEHPIGFKPVTTLIATSLDQFYYMRDYKNQNGIGYSEYEFSFNFDAEPDVLYGFIPVYRTSAGSAWKEAEYHDRIDFQNQRYSTFKGPPKEDDDED